MKTVMLESSALFSCRYDKKKKQLEVFFTDGTAHAYQKVPQEIYEALIHAKSPGGYFNGSIRGKYDYE